MSEIWRDIIYEGVTYDGYQVSNFGNVKSLNYHRTGRERLLKHSKNTDGYLQVCLSKDKKKKIFLVHRLVAYAFLENTDKLPDINHKD